MMKVSRVAGAAFALLASCVLTLGLAAPVHATTSLITLSCVGTENSKYEPPVTNTPQTVHVTVDNRLGPCPITPDPQLTGGTFHIELNPTASCTSLALLPSGTHPETYKWNNGQQSKINFAAVAVTRLANGSLVVVWEGEVTQGLGAGSTAIKTVTNPNFSLVCITLGMATNSGLVTLEFLG